VSLITMLFKIIVLAVALQVVVGDSAVDKLIRAKKEYISGADPGNFTLKIGVSLVCGTINRRTNTLTSRVFERYTWRDERLAWNPKDFSGLTKVSIPSEKVWTPDVKLFNAYKHSEERDDDVNVNLLANGTVIWIPPATYTTLCEEHDDDDDHYYKCKLQLAPWTYDSKDMPMELFEEGFDTKHYLKNCPYVVKHSSVRIRSKLYDCCPTPFLQLQVNLDMEHVHDEDDEEEEEEEAKKKRWELHTSVKKCFWPHC